jgi:uncharacterized protein YeaC (DUF1315 family)
MKTTEFIKESIDQPEYNDEVGMVKNNLHTLVRTSVELAKSLQGNENLPEWCQEKIAVAKSMIVAVGDYMISQHEMGQQPEIDSFDMDRAFAEAMDEGNEVLVPAALEMLKKARAYLDQFDPEDDDDYFDAYETIAAEFNMESNDSSIDPLTDLLDMYEVNPQQAAQALADHLQSKGVAEDAASVKYGVFSKGGSIGSQKFKDEPLKTFDSKEEAIADARRRRSSLSKGERGYYRMGYVVKAIKGVAEAGMSDQHKENHLKAVRAYQAKKKAEKEQRSADSKAAFGSMFGGSPADLTKNLKIRESGKLKEDATGGGTGSSSVAVTMQTLGEKGAFSKKEINKKLGGYTNQLTSGGPVKIGKAK